MSEFVVKECRISMFIGDMDISYLTTHVQYIKAEKLKEGEMENNRYKSISLSIVIKD